MAAMTTDGALVLSEVVTLGCGAMLVTLEVTGVGIVVVGASVVWVAAEVATERGVSAVVGAKVAADAGEAADVELACAEVVTVDSV
jgi:hypothetical protein